MKHDFNGVNLAYPKPGLINLCFIGICWHLIPCPGIPLLSLNKNIDPYADALSDDLEKSPGTLTRLARLTSETLMGHKIQKQLILSCFCLPF